MSQIDANKLMDFFRYFRPDSPQHKESVRRLHEGLLQKAPELLEESSYWITAYRKRPSPPAVTPKQRINDAGLRLIQNSEGLRLKAYQDSVGVWTIGYGHTADVKPGQTITETEALAFLRADVGWAEAAVEKLVTVPLTPGQFGALVSFVFNLGAGALGESTLLKLLNQGHYEEAAAQFGKWVFAGGKVLEGLVTRRDNERRMFLNGMAPVPKAPAVEKASVQGKVVIQAQHRSDSCGQTCVAMVITLLGEDGPVDDNWVDQHFGFALLGALNRCTPPHWVDAGNFAPSMWPKIEANLRKGYPSIVFLNGPDWSPSGYGHIVLIVSVNGDDLGVIDPNGGVLRAVKKRAIETAPQHTSGNAVLMVE